MNQHPTPRERLARIEKALAHRRPAEQPIHTAMEKVMTDPAYRAEVQVLADRLYPLKGASK